MFHRSNKTAGDKRGLVESSPYDALLPYVAGPDEPPRYALHFGTMEKLGVNPRSEYDTPLAVCAYPLTEAIFEQFLKIDLPFAQDTSKYLYLLEIKPGARVFYSTPRFFKQGIGPEYIGETPHKWGSEGFFFSTRPKDYEDSPKYASERHQTVARAARWGRKLLSIGIDVWVDADREGILHSNEPSQVMFFSPLSYSIVLLVPNPKNEREARYGRAWRRREDVRRAVLTDTTLRSTDLSGMDLSGENLANSDLTDANLTGAYLSGANLTGAGLSGANLTRADLSGANLYGANLRFANLYRANLRDANLTGADLRGAGLSGANLTGANLTGANLTRANLTGADLTRANLHGANLYRADLYRADLSGADLSGADLTDANLSRANLTDATLDGIRYNSYTQWPYAFTPPPSAL